MATKLRNPLETAFSGVISAASVGTSNIYKGFSSGDKALPCVICSAKSVEEEPLFSGNYRAVVEISVKGIGALDADAVDPLTAFDTLCSLVYDAIRIDDLATQLMANSVGLTVWSASAGTKVSWDTDEDCFVERYEVEIYCCPRDF